MQSGYNAGPETYMPAHQVDYSAYASQCAPIKEYPANFSQLASTAVPSGSNPYAMPSHNPYDSSGQQVADSYAGYDPSVFASVPREILESATSFEKRADESRVISERLVETKQEMVVAMSRGMMDSNEMSHRAAVQSVMDIAAERGTVSLCVRPIHMIEKTVEVPHVITREYDRHVPKPEIIERIIEVPKTEIKYRTVQLPPQIQEREVIEEVPQVVIEEYEVHVPKRVIQERLIEVPKVRYVERIEYEDVIEYREVPVDKIVEVPEIEYRVREVVHQVPQTYIQDVYVPRHFEVPITQVQEVHREEEVLVQVPPGYQPPPVAMEQAAYSASGPQGMQSAAMAASWQQSMQSPYSAQFPQACGGEQFTQPAPFTQPAQSMQPAPFTQSMHSAADVAGAGQFAQSSHPGYFSSGGFAPGPGSLEHPLQSAQLGGPLQSMSRSVPDAYSSQPVSMSAAAARVQMPSQQHQEMQQQQHQPAGSFSAPPTPPMPSTPVGTGMMGSQRDDLPVFNQPMQSMPSMPVGSQFLVPRGSMPQSCFNPEAQLGMAPPQPPPPPSGPMSGAYQTWGPQQLGTAQSQAPPPPSATMGMAGHTMGSGFGGMPGGPLGTNTMQNYPGSAACPSGPLETFGGMPSGIGPCASASRLPTQGSFAGPGPLSTHGSFAGLAPGCSAFVPSGAPSPPPASQQASSFATIPPPTGGSFAALGNPYESDLGYARGTMPLQQQPTPPGSAEYNPFTTNYR